jgi:plastocyanin
VSIRAAHPRGDTSVARRSRPRLGYGLPAPYLLPLALLVACSRPAGDTQPHSSPVGPPTGSSGTTPALANSQPKTESGFDETLFAAVAPGTMVGQILDRDNRPHKEAIVYVKDGLRPMKYPAQAAVTVNQRDKTFQPRILPVLVGTKVSFKNSDMVLHNVYSRSRVKTFDLGAYAHDESKGTTFDEPGRVDVFCAIHTNMHAIVLVLDNPFFATTDARGQFEIRNVPVGAYTLQIWSERGEEQVAHVDMGAERGGVVRAKLP